MLRVAAPGIALALGAYLLIMYMADMASKGREQNRPVAIGKPYLAEPENPYDTDTIIPLDTSKGYVQYLRRGAKLSAKTTDFNELYGQIKR